jgi:integrase
MEIPTLRIHGLRHSFAAVGATSGQSLPIIGAILGLFPVNANGTN